MPCLKEEEEEIEGHSEGQGHTECRTDKQPSKMSNLLQVPCTEVMQPMQIDLPPVNRTRRAGCIIEHPDLVGQFAQATAGFSQLGNPSQAPPIDTESTNGEELMIPTHFRNVEIHKPLPDLTVDLTECAAENSHLGGHTNFITDSQRVRGASMPPLASASVKPETVESPLSTTEKITFGRFSSVEDAR